MLWHGVSDTLTVYFHVWNINKEGWLYVIYYLPCAVCIKFKCVLVLPLHMATDHLKGESLCGITQGSSVLSVASGSKEVQGQVHPLF